MRQGRRGNHHADRISKLVRDSLDSDFAREAGERIKTLVTAKPIVSTCLGLAIGFALGTLIRRRG